MKNLLERLELTEAKGAVIHVRELPGAIRKVLKEVGFKKSDITVVPEDRVSLQGYSGEGYRAFAAVVNLETGQYSLHWGDWGGPNAYAKKAVDWDDKKHAIPPNKGAVVLGYQGGTGPVGATVYVHPDTISGFLPPQHDLTDRQQSILGMCRYTSAYKKELFQRNDVTPEEIDDLVKAGFIARSSSGATRLTISGKNVVQGMRW
ncbi:MAG: hypothetical protein PHI12_12590 [Dehalococcoidales bacterium]|nr:hypothetical protein [Dehalococcoidales bacterium]